MYVWFAEGHKSAYEVKIELLTDIQTPLTWLRKVPPPAEDALIGTSEARSRLHTEMALDSVESMFVAAAAASQHRLWTHTHIHVHILNIKSESTHSMTFVGIQAVTLKPKTPVRLCTQRGHIYRI